MPRGLGLFVVPCLVLSGCERQVRPETEAIKEEADPEVLGRRLPSNRHLDYQVSEEGRQGMTWGVYFVFDELNVTQVGCTGFPRENGRRKCGAYYGSTPCSEARPILCVRVDGRARPPYGVWDRVDQFGWVNGELAVSQPVVGTELQSLSHANEICAQQLGEGFRMAEFHDGRYVEDMDSDHFFGDTWPEISKTTRGQWAFFGTGIIEPEQRMWVAIDDQYANCWD